MSQVVECLSSKHEALSLNPCTTKKYKQKKPIKQKINLRISQSLRAEVNPDRT
jgi:hypothetical protein